MIIKNLIVFVFLIAVVNCNTLNKIKQKMEADGIVPQQIEESPPALITVKYPSGAEVALGAELTPLQVKDEPEVSWQGDPDKFYTLIMYDPDAPSRESPILADVKHWLIGNIKGSDISTGDVIAEYAGSGPPKGTGLHRYIFLVFEQKNGKLPYEQEPKSGKTSRAHRLSWSMRAFRKKYDLGKAYFGNFYKAQWDEYVEERKKHFTDN